MDTTPDSRQRVGGPSSTRARCARVSAQLARWVWLLVLSGAGLLAHLPAAYAAIARIDGRIHAHQTEKQRLLGETDARLQAARKSGRR